VANDDEQLQAQVFELQSRLAVAERERDELAQHCAEQKHRIRNALQALGLIVAAQARDSRHPEQCVRCISRIGSISELNDALCEGEVEISAAHFLTGLSSSIQQAFGDRFDFETKVEVADCLEPDRARAVGLIFCEAAMNALKHGFKNRSSGRLITCFSRNGDRYELIVEDDGKGFKNLVIQDGHGLGYIKELTNQLGGVLTIEPLQPGSRVRLNFPCSRA
jgi:two-component system, sensor histidine kinase PdtaS